jgi:expansin (peptidoglycan-binding protein)
LVVAASLVPATAALGHEGPPGVEPRDGTATFTDLTGPGACSFLGEPPDNLHVGLASVEYSAAGACGGYLDVTGPSGTVRVKVTDHCNRCAPGLVDVTRTAFARIADEAAGRAPVTYRLVRNPPLAESISLRVKTGSSPWWMQIQALDHGNPIAAFELRTGDGWRSLVHAADNFWTAASPGPGEGPFTVRITDVFGQQVTIDDVELAPDVVQATTARLYPSEPGPPTPATGDLPTDDPPATTQPAVLAPPLSLPPPADAATRSGSRSATDRAEADADADAGDQAPAGTGGGAPVWPLFLVLLCAAAVARAIVRRRARAESPTQAPRAGGDTAVTSAPAGKSD